MAINQLVIPEHLKGLLKEVLYHKVMISYMDTRLIDDPIVIEIVIGDRNVSITVTINHNNQ